MIATLSDVFWISVAAFGAFELALGINYLFLKYLLRAMHARVRNQK
jgi:hypothetical protein